MLHNIISASADKNLIAEISSVYDKIKTKDLPDIKSSSVFDWSDIVIPEFKIDKDASYETLIRTYYNRRNDNNCSISEEKSKDILAFIHMYINTMFSVRLAKLDSKLFINLYNACVSSLSGDRSRYMSDEVFKAKIRKMAVIMKADGTLGPIDLLNQLV
jgi:hypothetical protein